VTAVHDASRAEIADLEAGCDAYLAAWKRAIEPVL
jgi:hypothetical protein